MHIYMIYTIWYIWHIHTHAFFFFWLNWQTDDQKKKELPRSSTSLWQSWKYPMSFHSKLDAHFPPNSSCMFHQRSPPPHCGFWRLFFSSFPMLHSGPPLPRMMSRTHTGRHSVKVSRGGKLILHTSEFPWAFWRPALLWVLPSEV